MLNAQCSASKGSASWCIHYNMQPEFAVVLGTCSPMQCLIVFNATANLTACHGGCPKRCQCCLTMSCTKERWAECHKNAHKGWTLACLAVQQVTGHLKSACSQYCGLIIQRVLYSSQTIPNCVLDLGQGVICRPLYEHSTGGGIPHILYKCVLVFPKDVLVHLAGIPTSSGNTA